MTCGCQTHAGINVQKSFFVNAVKKWMQKAVTHPGAFHDYASKHGGLQTDGSISVSWAHGLLGDDKIPGNVRRQANLFIQFHKANESK